MNIFPLKGQNVRIPIITRIKGRGTILMGQGLVAVNTGKFRDSRSLIGGLQVA